MMTGSKDILDSLPVEKIIDRIRETGSLAALYLFGSSVKGAVREESDLDLAVLFHQSPDPVTVLDLKEDLSGITGREVDLAVLNTASPILGMQVIRYGIPVAIPDTHEAAKWVMVTISMYHDLKMIRRPIEEAILKEAADG